MEIDSYTANTQAVRDVMRKYISGAAGDTAVLRDVCHQDAAMFGHLGDNRRDVPMASFIDGVGQFEGALAGEAYAAEIVNINVYGLAAAVTLIETDYRGHDFVNFFTLAKYDDCWKIVTKTFTRTKRMND